MATQNKPCPVDTFNPWLFEDFTGIGYGPLPGLWYLDGSYQDFFFASGYYSYVGYFSRNLGWDASNVKAVNSLTLNIKGIKSTGLLSEIYVAPCIGLGDSNSFTLNYVGNDTLLFLSSSPQDVTINYTPIPLGKAFAKANLTNPNFFIAAIFTLWFVDDVVSIDNINYGLDYVEIDPGGGNSTFRNRGGSRGRLFNGVR